MIQRFNSWRRVATLVAIVSLFFHVGLSVLQTPVQTATDDDHILICTSIGMKVVAIADLDGTQPIPDHGSLPGGIEHCPVCVAAHAASFAILAFAAAIAQSAETQLSSPSPPSISVAAAIHIADSGPRAPPSIV